MLVGKGKDGAVMMVVVLQWMGVQVSEMGAGCRVQVGVQVEEEEEKRECDAGERAGG